MNDSRHYLCMNSTSTNEKKENCARKSNKICRRKKKFIIEMFRKGQKIISTSGRKLRIALSSVTACVRRILYEIDVEQKSIEINTNCFFIVLSSFNIFRRGCYCSQSRSLFLNIHFCFLCLFLQIVCRQTVVWEYNRPEQDPTKQQQKMDGMNGIAQSECSS